MVGSSHSGLKRGADGKDSRTTVKSGVYLEFIYGNQKETIDAQTERCEMDRGAASARGVSFFLVPNLANFVWVQAGESGLRKCRKSISDTGIARRD